MGIGVSFPFFMAFLLALQHGPAVSEWLRFTPPDKSFSIDFPQKPTEKVKNVKTASGPLNVRVYVVSSNKGKPAWFVSYSEKPAQAPKPSPAKEQLNRAKDAALETTKGTLESEKRITLNNSPGLELLIATQKGKYFRSRMYISDGRLYQIFLVGSQKQVNSDEAKHFLGSFKLLSAD